MTSGVVFRHPGRENYARRLFCATALAGLLAGSGSSARQSDSRPFTPEAEAFVESYLKAGGDKLTTWVQGDKTSRPEEARRAFQPIAGLTMELVASEPVIRQPVDLHFDARDGCTPGRADDAVLTVSARNSGGR